MGGVGIGGGGAARWPSEEERLFVEDDGRAGVQDLVDGREGKGYWPDG